MQRVLKIVEPVSLAAVLVALLICAWLRVDSAALLTVAIAVLSLLPFFLRFEMKKPRPRDIMPVVVLCAIACIGRIIFAPMPGFQPVSAIVIVAGLYFGRQNGFMAGALCALASNMFFGQGAWTPWQMYAWGLMGFMAGALAHTRLFEKKAAIYIFGAAASFLYGLLMDTWFLVGFTDMAGTAGTLAVYAAGMPFNISHAASTVVFLMLVLIPWGRKIERIKLKYGISEI